ncbi:MAG: citrate/2-methylcitrate synthase [Candidatus Omnitrophica bacterium]|nr:citrate/2-methylcitrate synthase [Candidatus Omnitrophota bacterium]
MTKAQDDKRNEKLDKDANINSKFDEWGKMATEKSLVDPSLYAKYDVKRGLRDISGKGVLAGLTQIGEVIAYGPDGAPAPGQLIYRGIDISQIVQGFTSDNHFGFEETCYLLLFGDLPSRKELDIFQKQLAEFRILPKRFVHDAILKMPSQDIMNAMARSVLAMYTLDENPEDISIENILKQSMRLIAVFPLLSVYSYQALIHHFEGRSLVIHHPVPELSTAENILHMLRPDNKYSALEAKLLDLALVLHAEHGGGNNSSFTTHVVSSSGTDTYGTIAAALGSLKGPRHGGANIKAVQMFEDMKQKIKDWDDDKEIECYLASLLNKKAFDRSGLIYGVGHAVYSVSDPRTLILRQNAEKLAKEKGMEKEFRLHEKVERLAPEVIGKTRKIYKGVSANVDFYSGFVYKMMDMPSELFTPLFAIARIAGWSAHRIEEMANGGKIIRPAYKSVASRRDYVRLDNR